MYSMYIIIYIYIHTPYIPIYSWVVSRLQGKTSVVKSLLKILPAWHSTFCAAPGRYSTYMYISCRYPYPYH